MKKVQSGSYPSFEYATWELTIRNKSIHFTLHSIIPPYSLKNKSTNQAFLDNFTVFVMELLPRWANNVLMGDFNLYVSKENDINSTIFLDTLEGMGLYQHVVFPTHKSGNTLDLIISEIEGTATMMTTDTWTIHLRSDCSHINT